VTRVTGLKRGGRITHNRIMLQSAVVRASSADAVTHEKAHEGARITHNRFMIQSAVVRASSADAVNHEKAHEEARTTHSRIMIQSAVVRASGVDAVNHEKARTTHSQIMIQSTVVRASSADAVNHEKGAHHPQPDHDPVTGGASISSPKRGARITHSRIMIQSTVVRASQAPSAARAPPTAGS